MNLDSLSKDELEAAAQVVAGVLYVSKLIVLNKVGGGGAADFDEIGQGFAMGFTLVGDAVLDRCRTEGILK